MGYNMNKRLNYIDNLLGCAGVGAKANFLLTLVICYPLTYVLCVGVEKVPYLRLLFGLSAKKK